MASTSTGITFEARAHRLFLAQGSFAERGLLPAATSDRRMLATDIDVLVSEYGSGFHLTRRHVECKSGRFSLLDRVLWLHGVRALLRADSSYLIAKDVDLSAAEFARALDVELFTEQHLHAWEKALEIPADSWPCRSNYVTFDSARRIWNRLSTGERDEPWRVLRGALAFIEVESWLKFRYRRLNKLFRLIDEVSRIHTVGILNPDQELCARYVFSGLLVRLSQYSLAICADVAGILPIEVEKYLTNRLVFGDQDATQAAELTTATVAWVREGLLAKGIAMPVEIDPARLQSIPPYAPEVVSLVRRLLAQSLEARYLPLAVERMQFGIEGDNRLRKFRAAAASGEALAALLKAFVARAFKVPTALATPVHADLMGAYAPSSTGGLGKSAAAIAKQSQQSKNPQPSTNTEGRSRKKGADLTLKAARTKAPTHARKKPKSKFVPERPKQAQGNLLPITTDE